MKGFERPSLTPKLEKTEKTLEKSNPFDWEQVDDEAIERFKRIKKSDELWKRWAGVYGNNPQAFFEPDNLQNLSGVPAAERLALLHHTTLFLETRPSDVEKYFDHFPSDRALAVAIFYEENGPQTDGLSWSFFNAAMPSLAKIKPDLVEDRGGGMGAEQCLEIAARREHAPDHLLKEAEPMGWAALKDRYGEAGARVAGVLDQANEMHGMGDEPLDARNIFAEEFDQLPPDQQAAMLRDCMRISQHALVFDEAFNSAFTRERVEEMNDRYKKEDGFPFNIAHSMLFGTIQPSRAYHMSEAFFEREMSETAEHGGAIEEYPFHKILLAALHAFPKVATDQRENTELLVDFWNKNRNPIFTNAVVSALSSQDAPLAAGELLKLLKDEKRDKNALAAILYRLELGRIGISPEGVQYLGRLYDLGHMNNPDYFASRLTVRGDMGVFDADGVLQSCFNLGDLTREESNIHAEMYAITEDLLFASRAEANSPETLLREKLLNEFREKYFTFYNERFFETTGVRFNSLSFREQGQLLFFANRAGDEKREEVFEFIKRFGEDGFRTFLALEYDRSLGDKILKFAAVCPQEARTVFSQFSAIADVAEESRQFLGKEFGTDQERAKDIAEAVTDQMLRRSKDLLAGAIQTASVDVDALKRRLEQTRTAAIAFATAFRVLREKGKLSLESIPDSAALSFSMESGVEAKQDVSVGERMAALYRKAHVNERKELVDRLIAMNEQALMRPDSQFFLMRHHDDLIGMMRFDERRDESGKLTSLYFGGFNVDDDYGNGKLGEAIFESAFERMTGLGVPIEAHCDPKTFIGLKYLDWGFVVDRTDYGELSGPRWHITMDTRVQYPSRKLSNAEIIKRANKPSSDNIRVVQVSAPPIEIEAGFVLVRMVHYNSSYYAVFEEIS